MAGVSIISRLGAELNQKNIGGDGPRSLTRYIGGHNRDNIPYINGYWQFLLEVPKKIYTDKAGIDTNIIQRWFLSTAEGFTPHTRNLNKADIPGQGGVGASFPTGQTINRTFTVTFREYKNLTMLRLINIWSGIFDQHTGVSELLADEWVPSSFKGIAYAILTKPIGVGQKEITANDLEEVWCYDGVWPESSPTDALNQDIASNDSVQLSTTWNFDGAPLSLADDIGDQVVSLLNGIAVNGYAATWNGIHDAVVHGSTTGTGQAGTGAGAV